MGKAESSPRLADTMHPAHARVAALLPWYVNGSLDAGEHALVRAHLGECLVCRRELSRLTHLARAVSDMRADDGCGEAFARLAARIDVAAQPWYRRALRAFVTVLAPLPLAVGATVIAGAVLLVAFIVPEGTPAPGGGQSFQTLGQHASGGTALERPRLRVVLHEGLGEAERDAWLTRHRAVLIDGPSPIGVMTVSVPPGNTHLEKIVNTLRGDADTLFVEPLSQLGRRPDRRP